MYIEDRMSGTSSIAISIMKGQGLLLKLDASNATPRIVGSVYKRRRRAGELSKKVNGAWSQEGHHNRTRSRVYPKT